MKLADTHNSDSNRSCLHIIPSNGVHSSRLLKELSSLNEAKILNTLEVIGINSCNDEENAILSTGNKIWRVPLFRSSIAKGTLKRILQFIVWQLKILRQSKAVSIVHIHNIALLPLGVWYKYVYKARLIYDAHELETERNGWSWIRKIMAKCVEQLLAPKVDALIVVSTSIETWYRKEFPLLPIITIKNKPLIKDLILSDNPFNLRKLHNIKKGDVLFLYQGLLSHGRSIRLLLEVFSKLPHHLHLVIMGYGELESDVIKASHFYPNIHFQPAAPPNTLHLYTRTADVGLCLIERTCLSYYYSLPNKLYEYLLCGLPVIGSDFPEISKIIQSNRVGWTCEPTYEKIIHLIKHLTQCSISEMAHNTRINSTQYAWPSEAAKLISLYKQLL